MVVAVVCVQKLSECFTGASLCARCAFCLGAARQTTRRLIKKPADVAKRLVTGARAVCIVALVFEAEDEDFWRCPRACHSLSSCSVLVGQACSLGRAYLTLARECACVLSAKHFLTLGVSRLCRRARITRVAAILLLLLCLLTVVVLFVCHSVSASADGGSC